MSETPTMLNIPTNPNDDFVCRKIRFLQKRFGLHWDVRGGWTFSSSGFVSTGLLKWVHPSGWSWWLQMIFFSNLLVKTYLISKYFEHGIEKKSTENHQGKGDFHFLLPSFNRSITGVFEMFMISERDRICQQEWDQLPKHLRASRYKYSKTCFWKIDTISVYIWYVYIYIFIFYTYIQTSFYFNSQARWYYYFIFYSSSCNWSLSVSTYHCLDKLLAMHSCRQPSTNLGGVTRRCIAATDCTGALPSPFHRLHRWDWCCWASTRERQFRWRWQRWTRKHLESAPGRNGCLA